MAGRWVGGMRGLCIRGPLHTSSPLLKLGRLGLGLPTQRVVASVEAEAQKSRAAEDGWSPKSPRPVLRPRQDGRCGQRAPALHPACCTPGGLGFCLPDSLPAVPAARGTVWPPLGPPPRWSVLAGRGAVRTARSRPPPAPCPQNRTTASRGTTSCTRATARAAPTCWWSTPRPAASAARWTCSWPRPSSSRYPPAIPSSCVVSRGPRPASGRTSRKDRSEVTWHPTHSSHPRA